MGLFYKDPLKYITLSQENQYRRLLPEMCSGRNNLHHTILSGGEAQGRARVLMSLIRLAWGPKESSETQPMPMLILHVNNPVLEKLCRAGDNVVFKGQGTYRLEPLKDIRDAGRAASIVFAAAFRQAPCTPGFREALKMGMELLLTQGQCLTIGGLHRLPWSRLPDYADQLANQKKLSPEEAMQFISRAEELRSELYAADAYFEKLYCQFGLDNMQEKSVGLKEALEGNARVCVNLVSNRNRIWRGLLEELISEELSNMDRQFLLILDDIRITPQDTLYDLLADRGNRYAFLLSGEDLPAMLGEKFEEIAAGQTNLILFSHLGGTSAEMLATHIGKSYQQKITSANGQTRDMLQPIGGQSSKTRSVEEELRHVIQPAMIQKMEKGKAIVITGGGNGQPWVVDYMEVLPRGISSSSTGQLNGRNVERRRIGDGNLGS